uniref:hypothetical protein n=1 Tax=Marinobacterium profundum TaxID=1714300 RepID=UPI0008374B7B|nr:hypothetical protein [Marinobacterium profundum]
MSLTILFPSALTIALALWVRAYNRNAVLPLVDLGLRVGVALFGALVVWLMYLVTACAGGS